MTTAHRPQPPEFIAFTGVDRIDVCAGMSALSARYPIEWGILVDAARGGRDVLFPDASLRRALLEMPGLRWAAHICGDAARAIAAGNSPVIDALTGIERVQVNHGFSGSSSEQVAASATFARALGVRAVLQCQGSFPDDARVDWLFDASFGRGVAPKSWPPLPSGRGLCGYSGGIRPDNARDVLAAIAAPAGSRYWIDMESGVRTDGAFDLAKCAAVCSAVYDS